MEQVEFNRNKLINYWIKSSDEDFDTMLSLFENKRYSWALFVGHLMMEKLLKALYVKTHNDYPPYIHNLLRIAEKCEIELNETQKIFLVTVTAFNINARYDDYKMSFSKKCTIKYTSKWIENLKIYRSWIKQLIIQ